MTKPSNIQIPRSFIPLAVTVVLAVVIIPLFALVSGQQEQDRDLQRIAHITLIQERMEEVIEEGGELPLPQNAVELYLGEELLGYQGILGDKAFRMLGLKVLNDPDDEQSYHYFVRPTNNTYEILSVLEEAKYANTPFDHYPLSFSEGSSRGNFIIANQGDSTGTLIHQLTKKGQKVDLLDESKRSKLGLFIGTSCQEILENQSGAKSGIYLAKMGEDVRPVYCDMKTDGGGWTLFYANHGYSTDEYDGLAYIHMREHVQGGDVFELYDYEDPFLEGLLDAEHFVGRGAREILLRNRKGETSRWVKLSFSQPSVLSWALGAHVLGNGNESCLSLGQNETWSITNEDASIFHEGLSEIMTHNGTGWGVSHENFWCNNFFRPELSHLAFYNARHSRAEARARGTNGIGGMWGGENEYRYFIR